MQDKQSQVLAQFFNNPKYWHFEELHKAARISKPQLSNWLQKLAKEGLVKKVKPRGKMPYYIAMEQNPDFRYLKRLYAIQLLTDCGFLSHLASLKGVKVAILFGSFSRYDWYDHSDIDVFIFGDDQAFEQGKFELKLRREIQVHTAKNQSDLQRMEKLLPYIIAGDFIKGSIEELGVEVHAKV